MGRRHPGRRGHGLRTRVLRRRRPALVGRGPPRELERVLEVVRRVQGHARPAARDRQADDRARQRDRGRRRERAADGVRPLGDGRQRVHPARRAPARLGARGRRDAVAPAHGRRPESARDRLPLRRDPGRAGGGVGAREPRRPRGRARRGRRRVGREARGAAAADDALREAAAERLARPRMAPDRRATRATGSRCRCSGTRRRTPCARSSSAGRRLADGGRGAHRARRRGPHDHAQPAGRLQRDQPGDARGARCSAARGRRSCGSRRRAHRSRARVLLGAGPAGVRVAPRRCARGARADLPPERARDPQPREAGRRRGERSCRGRRPLARLRVRRAHRVGGCELRARVHRDRARAGRRKHVVRPSPARLRPRVRMDGVEPAPERRRGARLGPRLGGRRRPTASLAAPPSWRRGTRRCPRARLR